MKDLRTAIPEEFWKRDAQKPYACDVGELIEQLQSLPKQLPIKQGFGNGCILTVANVKGDAFLEIEEAEDDL